MKEKTPVGGPPTIFVRNETSRCWEERIVYGPGKARTLGGVMLGALRKPRFYEYTDAVVSLALIIEHLLR